MVAKAVEGWETRAGDGVVLVGGVALPLSVLGLGSVLRPRHPHLRLRRGRGRGREPGEGLRERAVLSLGLDDGLLDGLGLDIM